MKIITLSGQIEILSGLHIGGGDDTMKIGGIDSGVIKDINTNKPYIPGSSIKGKMRSLLEWNNRLVVYGSGQPFSSNLLEKIPEKAIYVNKYEKGTLVGYDVTAQFNNIALDEN